MSLPWQIGMLCVGAYLVGGVPFGLILASLKRVDLRRQGSGNVGATNVGRVLGARWGLFVFLLDVSKGAATTISARFLLMHSNQWADAGPAVRDWVWIGTGVCCVLGNVLPVYIGFRGGKGVATSLGAILGIYPYLTWPGLTTFALWAVVVKWTGYISLGSIVAACSLPVAFLFMMGPAGWALSDHYPLVILSAGMAAIILVRHRSNISRLLEGTENRIGGRHTR